MTQVVSQNLSDAEISAIISSNNADTRVHLFELFPQFVKEQDQDKILKGFCEAVQSEYDRLKESITEVVTIIDPKQVNKNYLLSGNPVFFHPEQFIYGGTASSPNIVVFDGPVQGVAASGFYRDFGIFVWSDENTPTSVGQYRKVIAYDGSSKTAYLDQDWLVVPSTNAVYAMCWPDRVWLPTAIVSDPRKPGATLLPRQIIPLDNLSDAEQEKLSTNQVILLPGLSYLSTVDDYYVDWQIDFLDGANSGKSVKIISYIASDKLLIIDTPIKKPEENDWFRLTPPEGNSIGISDDYYKGRWIHVSPPKSDSVQYSGSIKVQSRQIISSKFDPLATPASHVAYIYNPKTSEGEQFITPAMPTTDYGITESYIPLQHLASYVGIELDEEDQEFYQREQISQAYNFHRLRGTRRAMELVCRSFGLDVSIDESVSNYVSAPSSEEVGPDAHVTGNHKQYNSMEVGSFILAGAGRDDVPTSFYSSPDSARIPDSDIKIYLSRNNNSVASFNSNTLFRIIKKLSPHLPIHVQIIFIGLLTKVQESIEVDPVFTCQIEPLAIEDQEVTELFVGTPIGTVPTVDSYSVETDESVSISTPARYSRSSARYGRFGAIPALARWSRGLVALL